MNDTRTVVKVDSLHGTVQEGQSRRDREPADRDEHVNPHHFSPP